MSAKTELLAIRCFSIKMTLGLPVMAILAFHLGHVPCHHVGVPKVHSKERARRRWANKSHMSKFVGGFEIQGHMNWQCRVSEKLQAKFGQNVGQQLNLITFQDYMWSLP